MTLVATTRPVISPHACICDEGPDLFIATPAADATLKLSALPALKAMLPCLMGQTPIGEMAQATGVPFANLATYLTALVDAEILWDATDLVLSSSPHQQLQAYYRLCDAWALDIFRGEFWSLLWSGQAPPALVFNWCEQFYHRTVGADLHNATAFRHCTLDAIRADLSQHYREEQGHGSIFIEGLAASGVAPASVIARGPNAATQDLINFMDVLGRTDSLAYLGCYGILHSPRVGQTTDAAHAQFVQLTSLYPFAAPAIDAFRRHLDIDLLQKHDEIALDRYVMLHGPLNEDEAIRILAAAHGMVQHFSAFFDGLLATSVTPALTCAPDQELDISIT